MKNKHAQLKLFTLFSLLLLFCTFESMAQEKLITINVKNVSLKEIFNIIENQTPYRFSYRSVVLAYIIHSGFISGYQNRYGDNLKPPTNVYHRMTA